MTPIEKRLLVVNSFVGAGLTLLVVIAVQLGGLDAMERWLYDRRVRDNQHFNAPPTDELLHLDIDDLSLESIGRWPWPRRVLGDIIDELNHAGAKAIALDIVFSEPQQLTYERLPDGKFVEYDNDALFAAAIKRDGKVIMPAVLKPIEEVNPILRAAADAFNEKVTLAYEDVQAALVKDGVISDAAQLNFDFYVQARREAYFRNIDQLLAKDINTTEEQVRAILLPHIPPEIAESAELTVLREQYRKARGFRMIRAYSRAVPTDVPDLLTTRAELAPIDKYGEASRTTAFVDYLADPDGVVRNVPLWMVYDGRLYPQLGLAMACVHLDIDPADTSAVQIEPHQLTLRSPGGRSIVIPTYDRSVEALSRDVAQQTPIPWFGRPNVWQNMYDFPDGRAPKQHMPAVFVYDVHRYRRQIRLNCEQAADAVVGAQAINLDLGDENRLTKIDAMRKAPHPALDDAAGWTKRVDEALAALKEAGFLEVYTSMSPQEVDDLLKGIESNDERNWTAWITHSIRALPKLRKELATLAGHVEEDEAKLRNQVQGKSVLIGWTATGTVDFVTTSVHNRCPGVIAHGAVFNAIVTGQTWTIAPPWVTPLITIVIGLLATAASAGLAPSRALPAAFALGLGYFFFNGVLLFDYWDTVVGTAGPISAVALVWSGCTLVRFIAERRERARVTRTFQSYVDPALVNYVLLNPKQARLDGQQRELTVVFTDLAGFTTLSEKLRERSVKLLNEYMSLMVPLIRKHRGYVNKFLGDGIMFFFGAPEDNKNHAVDAVRTVLDMQRALIDFNESLVKQELPRVQMRAGVATGIMVVGDAGSIYAADRGDVASDYTVLGDTVNLGARLESANKATGTLVMVNNRNAELIRSAFLIRPIGKLQVVGKSEGIMTWEPLARWEEAIDEQRRKAELWHGVVDNFVKGDFQETLNAIDAMDREVGVTKLTELYRRLSMEYLAGAPPEGFEGSIVLESK